MRRGHSRGWEQQPGTFFTLSAVEVAVLQSALQQDQYGRTVGSPLNWSSRDGLHTSWEPRNLGVAWADPIPPSTHLPSPKLAPRHLCRGHERPKWFHTAPAQRAVRRQRFELGKS